MPNKHNSSSFKTPTDIARETFRRLAIERIAPTPEAYSRLYQEISGVSDKELDKSQALQSAQLAQSIKSSEAEKLLASFAESLQQTSGDFANVGHRFSRALKTSDWNDFRGGIAELTGMILTPPSALPATPARNTLSLIDDLKPASSFTMGLTNDNGAQAPGYRENILKDLLYRILTLALTSLLKSAPDLATESEAIGRTVKEADNEDSLTAIGTRIKQLCFQIELKSGDSAEQQELLLRLFDLLLENVRELLDEDNWLIGQIAAIQNLISGPIDHRALQEVTRSLRDVIYKQGVLKHRLAESKTSVKNMMATFIDRLDVMAASTDNYHRKIDDYAKRISQTQDRGEVIVLVAAILEETRTVQSETIRSHGIMVAAQTEVKESEVRIRELEKKLEYMSELVREDQLTGSLNRRGLDDIFEREADRSDRRGTPMCIAMLDLDNFKKLNDTYGHLAGDEALMHLVRIVKKTLRSIDVIARYGGEEFVIVMPETTLDESALAMTRVQRELTTHFFTANDQHLFITFSAGVALRNPHEDQDSTVKRADTAMYEAKKLGKNQVVKAE